jgi:hypothetical protein
MASPLRWSVYYEPEASSDPPVEQLRADLTYLRDRYARTLPTTESAAVRRLRVGHAQLAADADRWKAANTVGAYVVLKLFKATPPARSQPDGWHEYAAAARTTIAPYLVHRQSRLLALAGDHAPPSAGYHPLQAERPQHGRFGRPFPAARVVQRVGGGHSSRERAEWASPSGHGQYLDALHNDGR